MATTMTIHEALCKVKINSERIMDKMTGTTFCTIKKANQEKIGGVATGNYVTQTRDTFNSIIDLIRFTDAVKAALSLSNAQTKVTVAGKEMTVAEVLYQMKYGIKVKKALLQILNKQYKDAVAKVEQENGDKLDEKVKKYIESSLGGREKVSAEDLRVATELYTKNNSYELVDPIKIADEIIKLQKEIDDFESNADSALQVSNATTTIIIDI